MRKLNKILTTSFIGTLLSVTSAHATETKPAAGSSVNITLYSLVGLIVILVFVIGMLGHTLRQLTAAVRTKIKSDKAQGKSGAKITAMLVFLLASLLPISSFAGDAPATAVAKTAEFIDGIPFSDFYMLLTIIALELLVIFALTVYIRVLLRVLRAVPETPESKAAEAKRSWFWDKFNAAATVEKEKEILLDHNYDGIQELDNSLPPWWKYGFYLTIIVGLIYVYRFHISHDGQSQQEEFAEEMKSGEEAKAAYLAKSANNVDESNVVPLTTADAIASGKDIFVKNCAACHLADGGGVVGPNLTDDYWLHGGSMKDVFKSIKYGWQDKGMKSWKDDLSPIQIQQVASYIRSLKGTHPATPKAPQGELYVEAGAKPDSTAATPATPKADK